MAVAEQTIVDELGQRLPPGEVLWREYDLKPLEY